MENKNNNSSNHNDQPLVSLVNLISDNLNNPNQNNNLINPNLSKKDNIPINKKFEKYLF